MALFEKRGQWYLDYYAAGRRIREKVGPNKRQAKRALDARRGEIASGRFQLAQVRRSPRFEEVAAEYLGWARANTRGAGKVAGLLRQLGRAFAGRTLREITPWLIERYKQERRAALVFGRPIRPTTINRELSCLRRLFTLAVQWGKAESNPVRGVKFFPEDGQRERILGREEIERLLAACTAHSRPLVLVALNTGMRRGEMLGLTWDRVDLAGGVLTLTHTKNGKVRRVPMNALVRETLRALPRSGPYVFGGARPYGAIKTAWLAACRRAGLSGVRFHDLRHTAATAMVLGGQDLATVKELLGHSDIGLTLRYTHPTPESKRRAVGVLEGLVAAWSGHQLDTSGQNAVERRLANVRS